jgi:predicted  nucleic acid-binding Zn ribbon protein
MILATVTFGARRKNNPDSCEDAVHSYLAALAHAGQVHGEYFLAWNKGRLNAHVLLAGPKAWETRHHSSCGKSDLKKLVEMFGTQPAWKMLDDDAGKRASSWKGARFLNLHTHVADQASPICRGDGKPPVPVFMLPISFEDKERLYMWQRSYYHHDHVWLESSALEVEAYRQLADPESELSVEGRDLCGRIESATGVPTYYFLMRYWSRRIRDEAQRRCPGCGKAWRVERPEESPKRLWHFDFKCDRCRLVSDQGVSMDGGRNTRIGEFVEKEAGRTGRSDTPPRRR